MAGRKRHQPAEYRMKAKMFYLTFPKCGTQDKKAFIGRLNCEPVWGERLKWVVVGEEFHADKTKHVHTIFAYDRQRDTNSPHVFDFLVDPTKHGNYQTTRSRAKCIRYCTKDNDYLAEGIDVAPYLKGKGKFEEVAEMIHSGATLKDIDKKHPGFVLQNLNKIQAYQRIMVVKPSLPRFHLETFIIPAFDLELLTKDNKCLLIWGESGTGKSEYARAHFPKGFLEVEHLDTLLQLDPAIHSGIVFQDCEFSHRPPTEVIHLLDVNAEAQIHVRYQVARIPVGFPRIFTHNNYNPFYNNTTVTADQVKAIERRLERYHVQQPLFQGTTL